MKRISIALSVLVAVVAFSLMTAASASTKTQGDFNLSSMSNSSDDKKSHKAQVIMTYCVDNTGLVTLIATNRKQGSNFSDNWTGATKVSTVLVEDGDNEYYVSTATLSLADPLPFGTYPVTYDITMTAGHSEVSWTGETSASFTVTELSTWRKSVIDLPPGGGGGGTPI